LQQLTLDQTFFKSHCSLDKGRQQLLHQFPQLAGLVGASLMLINSGSAAIVAAAAPSSMDVPTSATAGHFEDHQYLDAGFPVRALLAEPTYLDVLNISTIGTSIPAVGGPVLCRQ